MRAIKGKAKNLRKNIKQNNIKPLLIVFGVLVMITVTYKSSNGLGNTSFKEGKNLDAEDKAKAAKSCRLNIYSAKRTWSNNDLGMFMPGKGMNTQRKEAMKQCKKHYHFCTKSTEYGRYSDFNKCMHYKKCADIWAVGDKRTNCEKSDTNYI